MLPAISLQASKFTKNELLHTYFSRILARFQVIIYYHFSKESFHGRFFHVSMRVVCFSDGVASVTSGEGGGMPHSRGIRLGGRGEYYLHTQLFSNDIREIRDILKH